MSIFPFIRKQWKVHLHRQWSQCSLICAPLLLGHFHRTTTFLLFQHALQCECTNSIIRAQL